MKSRHFQNPLGREWQERILQGNGPEGRRQANPQEDTLCSLRGRSHQEFLHAPNVVCDSQGYGGRCLERAVNPAEIAVDEEQRKCRFMVFPLLRERISQPRHPPMARRGSCHPVASVQTRLPACGSTFWASSLLLWKCRPPQSPARVLAEVEPLLSLGMLHHHFDRCPRVQTHFCRARCHFQCPGTHLASSHVRI